MSLQQHKTNVLLSLHLPRPTTCSSSCSLSSPLSLPPSPHNLILLLRLVSLPLHLPVLLLLLQGNLEQERLKKQQELIYQQIQQQQQLFQLINR